MNYCTNCGQKINESSRFCTKCGSKEVKDSNLSPTPKTRMEKKKSRSKTRLMAGVGSIMALLLVSGVTYSMVKGSHKPKPNTNVAATKTITPAKNKDVENKSKPSQNQQSKKDESSTLSSKDTILPASDKRVMQEEDLATLTKGQLRLARNEIYARHGYIFKSEDLQKYFANKSWYHPNPSFDGSLTEVEKQNVAIIKSREDHL